MAVNITYTQYNQIFWHIKRLLALFMLLLPSVNWATLQSAIMTDDYPNIFSTLKADLKRGPKNRSALFLQALYAHALKKSSTNQDMIQLEKNAPHYAKCLKSLIATVERPVATVPIDNSKHLAIVALGSPADSKGEPKKRLLNTLNKTLELANQYPNVRIYLTGGAVANQFKEADVMKRWLIQHGIQSKRIKTDTLAVDTVHNATHIIHMLPLTTKQVFVVTCDWHLKRATMIFDGVMGRKHIKVIPVGSGSELTGANLTKQQETERVASYRDGARALGYLRFRRGTAKIVINSNCNHANLGQSYA